MWTISKTRRLCPLQDSAESIPWFNWENQFVSCSGVAVSNYESASLRWNRIAFSLDINDSTISDYKLPTEPPLVTSYVLRISYYFISGHSFEVVIKAGCCMIATCNTWALWRRRTKKKRNQTRERTKINRHCVWTWDIANSTTSQMMRSCVCTASAHCWSPAAAAGAATIWRHRSHYNTKSGTSLNSRMWRWRHSVVSPMIFHSANNTKTVFHFHPVQLSWMKLYEHAPRIASWGQCWHHAWRHIPIQGKISENSYWIYV